MKGAASSYQTAVACQIAPLYKFSVGTIT